MAWQKRALDFCGRLQIAAQLSVDLLEPSVGILERFSSAFKNYVGADAGKQYLNVDGFNDIVIGSFPQRVDHILRSVSRCDHDDGQLSSRPVLSDFSEN